VIDTARAINVKSTESYKSCRNEGGKAMREIKQKTTTVEPGERKVVDFSKIANGSLWELVQGQDFTCKLSTLRVAAYEYAYEHGLKVVTRIIGNRMLIRFYSPELGPAIPAPGQGGRRKVPLLQEPRSIHKGATGTLNRTGTKESNGALSKANFAEKIKERIQG
jgi:hypothetical protein